MTTPNEMNRRAFIKSTAAVTAAAAVAPTARAGDAPADGLIHRNERSRHALTASSAGRISCAAASSSAAARR